MLEHNSHRFRSVVNRLLATHLEHVAGLPPQVHIGANHLVERVDGLDLLVLDGARF